LYHILSKSNACDKPSPQGCFELKGCLDMMTRKLMIDFLSDDHRPKSSTKNEVTTTKYIGFLAREYSDRLVNIGRIVS
jgi:hypothetical protein